MVGAAVSTSWTASDITALETAIKSGALRVRYGEREVQYRSLDEMMRLLAAMRDQVSPPANGATIFAGRIE